MYTQVSVVDASSLSANLDSNDLLADRQLASVPQDQRTIVDLLVDQIEFANVLLLNKVDLGSQEDARRLQALLGRLNPMAEVITCTHCQVPLDRILGTKRYVTSTNARLTCSKVAKYLSAIRPHCLLHTASCCASHEIVSSIMRVLHLRLASFHLALLCLKSIANALHVEAIVLHHSS